MGGASGWVQWVTGTSAAGPPAGGQPQPPPCLPAGPCPDGHFYLEDSASCLPCFCFGVTNLCQSSRRFRDHIRLSFDQPNDFKGMWMWGVKGPSGSWESRTGREGPGPKGRERSRSTSYVRKASSSIQIHVCIFPASSCREHRLEPSLVFPNMHTHKHACIHSLEAKKRTGAVAESVKRLPWKH